MRYLSGSCGLSHFRVLIGGEVYQNWRMAAAAPFPIKKWAVPEARMNKKEGGEGGSESTRTNERSSYQSDSAYPFRVREFFWAATESLTQGGYPITEV